MVSREIDKQCRPLVEKYLPYFENGYEKIKNSTNTELAVLELEKLYRYFKDISPEFFNGFDLIVEYRYLKYKILECEQILPQEFIISTKPNYKLGMMSEKIPGISSIEEKLNWIVYMTRRFLHLNFSYTNNKVDFNNLDLSNQCKVASKKVASLCRLLKLNCKTIVIYPGFTKFSKLFNGDGYHCINIITYKEEKYIVDCTYRQFFTIKYNNLERLGIVGLSGCRPGIFMLMNDDRKDLAQNILEKGWFTFTDENLKNYLDGFTLSYRNGLYYQATNDYSYNPEYQAKDYVRFLNGSDNQLKHEDEELLGIQRTLKPTKEIK